MEALSQINAELLRRDESLHGEQNWIWVVAADLDGYDGAAIRDMGHLRRKKEDNAFGELSESMAGAVSTCELRGSC